MLKHIVFLKFKPGTSDADIKEIEKGLAGLPARIPEIKRYEFGRDILRSDRSYDFALVSEFEDQDAMKRRLWVSHDLALLILPNGACRGIVFPVIQLLIVII